MATLTRIVYGTVLCGYLLLAKAKKALLVIDMQVDFISGSLAVGDAESIIENVNTLTALDWDLVVFSEDFHPFDHISFASNHPNKNAFEDIELSYTSLGQACGYMDKYGPSAANCTETGSRVSFTQTLWPDHCVQGTVGQKTDSRVKIPEGSIVLKKGLTLVVDSYGAFATNFEEAIGLASLSPLEQATFAENSFHSWLQRTGIKEIYVVGLALDYCVKYSSLQAKERGYTTYTVVDATRAVDPSVKESTVAMLKEKGIVVDMTTEKIKTSFEPTYTPTQGAVAQGNGVLPLQGAVAAGNGVLPLQGAVAAVAAGNGVSPGQGVVVAGNGVLPGQGTVVSTGSMPGDVRMAVAAQQGLLNKLNKGIIVPAAAEQLEEPHGPGIFLMLLSVGAAGVLMSAAIAVYHRRHTRVAFEQVAGRGPADP